MPSPNPQETSPEMRRETTRGSALLLRLPWVRHAEWHSTLDSTSSHAYRWLEANRHLQVLPAIFVADRQTAGRGRRGNHWVSPSGCLMFTLVIDSSWLPRDRQHWSQLALVCGVALAKTVQQTFASFQQTSSQLALKWPNDLYLQGKKCAGILIESGPADTWLIGIGLNVDMEFSSDLEVAHSATCLADHIPNWRVNSGAPTSDGNNGWPQDILTALLNSIQREVNAWSAGSTAWHQTWSDLCYLSGKTVTVTLANNTMHRGTCMGITSTGALRVATATTEQLFTSGTVRLS